MIQFPEPEHRYYGPHGEPISLERWGELYEGDRTLAENTIGAVRLKTVWLGIVDSRDPSARLYGSARSISGKLWEELELYDSREDALKGHYFHRRAIEDGHHCGACADVLTRD